MGFGTTLKNIVFGKENIPTIPCKDGTEGTENIPTKGDGNSIVYPFIAINNSSFDRRNPAGVSFSIPFYGESRTCNIPDYIAMDCPFDENDIVPAGLQFVGVILHGDTGNVAIIGRKV